MRISTTLAALRLQLDQLPRDAIDDEAMASIRQTIAIVLVGVVEADTRWQAPDNVRPYLVTAYLVAGPAKVAEARACPIDYNELVAVQREIELLIVAFDSIVKPGGVVKC